MLLIGKNMKREAFAELNKDISEYAEAGLTSEESYLIAKNDYKGVTEGLVRDVHSRHSQTLDYSLDENWEDLVQKRNLRLERLIEQLENNWNRLTNIQVI